MTTSRSSTSPVLWGWYKGFEKEDQPPRPDLGFWARARSPLGHPSVPAATGCILQHIWGCRSYKAEEKGKLRLFLHWLCGWELWGTPGGLCHLGKIRMRKVLRWGWEGEGADSPLPLTTLHKSTRWPWWAPTIHTTGLKMVILVVHC